MKTQEIKETLNSASKKLFNELKEGGSKALKDFLQVSANFHNYSFNNILMIYSQNPKAKKIAGFGTWKKLNRHVKKGEKSIKIIAPMIYKKDTEQTESEKEETGIRGFKAVSVFDISQTEGQELPKLNEVTGSIGDKLHKLETFIRSKNITVSYSNDLNVCGVSKGGQIEINADQSDAEKFTTLIHEYAHESLHNQNDRKELTKTIIETEAETVAFIVCDAIGLETNQSASDYIQLYKGNKEIIIKSLNKIFDTASDVIKAVN